jgi:small-conductance mechanosensitive channel
MIDFTGIEIVALIVAYGAYEYFKRERKHREQLTYLKRGEKPPVPILKVALWQLLTTGATALVLIAATGYVFSLALRNTPRDAPSVYLIGFVGTVITGMVVSMFLRDLRIYRRSAGKEARP